MKDKGKLLSKAIDTYFGKVFAKYAMKDEKREKAHKKLSGYYRARFSSARAQANALGIGTISTSGVVNVVGSEAEPSYCWECGEEVSSYYGGDAEELCGECRPKLEKRGLKKLLSKSPAHCPKCSKHTNACDCRGAKALKKLRK